MPILDGKHVNAKAIDPSKHRFIGAFREPSPPDPQGAAIIGCPCGQSLWTFEAGREHWQRGHFDQMQYESIKEPA